MKPRSLTSITATVSIEQLITDLVPPPQFSQVSFDNYYASATEPSQAAALAQVRQFCQQGTPAPTKRRWRLSGKTQPPPQRPGIYLDGGFGVGKTHLLASLWLAHRAPKSYGTFVEFTALVGMLGMRQAVEVFSSHALIAIDEFELDDPGDTVLMSTFLAQLADAGVRLAASSNTLPDRLGEERFAADSFLREIQGLAAHFEVVRIDGPDYRHRGALGAAAVTSPESLQEQVRATPGATLDSLTAVLGHLATVHPAKYGVMVAGLPLVAVTDVHRLESQADALRWVSFVDRLYDAEVPVIASGIPLTEIFSPEMLAGGYRKKYFRCQSRIAALTRSAQASDPIADMPLDITDQ